MKSVYKWFRRICPHIPAIQQKTGMGYGEREKFLNAFESGKYPHLVGFCVLGGMFCECIYFLFKSVGTTIIMLALSIVFFILSLGIRPSIITDFIAQKWAAFCVAQREKNAIKKEEKREQKELEKKQKAEEKGKDRPN